MANDNHATNVLAETVLIDEMTKPREPATPRNPIDALAERDRQHAPVDAAKRALGLPR